MENMFKAPDLLKKESSGDLSPLKFFVNSPVKIPEIPVEYFSSFGELVNHREDSNECYAKHLGYFSELEKEVEMSFNNLSDHIEERDSLTDSLFNDLTKDESKSSALSKFNLMNKQPSSTQVDQISVISEFSSDESEESEITTEKLCPEERKSADGEHLTIKPLNNSD